MAGMDLVVGSRGQSWEASTKHTVNPLLLALYSAIVYEYLKTLGDFEKHSHKYKTGRLLQLLLQNILKL